MSLVSQWVQNRFHLVGAVHPGWWTVEEGGALQQVEGLLKHFALRQQQCEEERGGQLVQGAELVLGARGRVR